MNYKEMLPEHLREEVAAEFEKVEPWPWSNNKEASRWNRAASKVRRETARDSDDHKALLKFENEVG